MTNFSIEEILKPDFGRTKTVYLQNDLQSLTFPSVVDIGVYKEKLSCSFRLLNQNEKNTNVYGLAKRETQVKTSQQHIHGKRSITSEKCKGKKSIGKCVDASRGTSESRACTSSERGVEKTGSEKLVWPAWVYCTRYSDRPSAGPRSRKANRKTKPANEKRPRTAFSSGQLDVLKREFLKSRYLTENRRQTLAVSLQLKESQIKIWFQNKRAKFKKASSEKSVLASDLLSQGLYDHSANITDTSDSSKTIQHPIT